MSVEHLAALANQSPYGVAIFSRQSGIQLWNRWLVDNTGIAEVDAKSRQLVDIFPALAGTPLNDRLEHHLLQGGDGFQWAEDSHRDQLVQVVRALGLDAQPGLSRLVCRAMFQGKSSLSWLEIIPREKAARPSANPGPLAAGGVKDRFPVYLESAKQGIVTIDNYGFIQAINPRLAEMLGYTVAELIDKPVRLLFPSLSATSGNENYRLMAENLIRQDSNHLLAAVSLDGKPLHLEVQVVDAVGATNQWTLCCRDVSSQQRLTESLLRQRQVISAIFNNTADAVLLLNRRGYLDNINPIGAEMLALGHRRHDNLHVDEVLNLQDAERSRLFPFAEAMSRERQVDFAEVSLELPGGSSVSVMVNAVPIRDQHNHGIGCMLVMRSISEARRISSRLSWHETHDPLTQLANRRQIENEVVWAIDDAHLEDSSHGLLYIDLYNFSMINETCGHAAGDELLRQFAGLLSQAAGPRDVVARIGNDEFAVLLWRLSAEDIRARAEQILAQVTGFSLPWHERRLKVGASIGIEVISRDSTTEADALLSARASCGIAKDFGRNRIHFPVHGKEFLSRHSISQLATRISEALEEDRLVLYCQPIVSLAGDHDVKHYEVLVRMIERDGKMVSPGEFIPAAESSGLIDDVDKWVFDRVLDALAAMSAERRVKFAFSVNLSGYTVSDEKFLAHVIERLTVTRLEPGVLQFEVTETAAVKHFDRAVDFINALNEFGCTFALDDFGIGLSSFAYLKQLPVNCLKIDGSFVRNMEVEDVDYSMVSTINHLAHVMGLSTVAECVENPTQAAMLREMGVDFGQGYYFAVPEPLEKILQEF